MNPLLKLSDHGQSYWLDNLTREALRSGALARRVQFDGLRGVTSNPKTFCDAVIRDSLYKDELEQLATQGMSTDFCGPEISDPGTASVGRYIRRDHL